MSVGKYGSWTETSWEPLPEAKGQVSFSDYTFFVEEAKQLKQFAELNYVDAPNEIVHLTQLSLRSSTFTHGYVCWCTCS